MNDKKENIITQVGQLYMRYGIRSVTMDEVSRELGISKKTLYQYFKDKEELVDQVVVSWFLKNPNFGFTNEDGINAVDRVLQLRSHLKKMMKLVHNNIDFDLRRHYPKTYKKLTDFKRKKIYEDNLSVLEQGKKEGLFREDFDSDFIARISVGRFLLIFNPDNELFSEDEVRDFKLFDAIIDYHFHGICTEKGLKYYKQQLNNFQNED